MGAQRRLGRAQRKERIRRAQSPTSRAVAELRGVFDAVLDFDDRLADSPTAQAIADLRPPPEVPDPARLAGLLGHPPRPRRPR